MQTITNHVDYSPPAAPVTAASSKRKDNEMAKKKAERSKAVAKTWKDPKTAKARASHHAVKVAGTVYRSVKDAFTQLKLPLGRRGPFRRLLKAEGVGGSALFEHRAKNGDVIKTRFTLIDIPSREAKAGKVKAASAKKAAKKKAVAKKAKPPAEKAAAPSADKQKRIRKPRSTAPVAAPEPAAEPMQEGAAV